MKESDVQWWCGYLSALQDFTRYVDEPEFDPVMEWVAIMTERAVYDIVKEAESDAKRETTSTKA